MTNTQPHDIRSHDIDAAIRKRILERAAVINEKLLSRLATVAQDIDEANYRTPSVVWVDSNTASMPSAASCFYFRRSSRPFTTNPSGERHECYQIRTRRPDRKKGLGQENSRRGRP